MMASPWIAALVALFLWWFSTGSILCAVRHADRGGPATRTLAVLAAMPLALLGAAGIWWTTGDTSPRGAYLAFGSALALWGWIELAFLAGVITGPNRTVMRPGVREWERFLRAWGTIAYHEGLLVLALVLLALIVWGAANPVALWTFGILFAARISAKLNLYLGVRKINTEFIPGALAHLPSHFRIARMNWLFPVSITGLSLLTGYWLILLANAATAGQAVGLALMASLSALALMEHWFMVLPLPDERLWRWMLPAPVTHQATRHSEEAP
ncbi:DUF3623 family protein [Rhodobacterales bacterium HKCCE3408]|nr:DUF3623 family protein [Rhodobacterales bacterium HKCCE3408]